MLITSSESIPALSAMIFGMTSKDFANIFMTSCSFPEISTACYLRPFESSISVAPPPATTLLVLKHLLTIMIASFSDLSASLMNCWAPPLRMIVADLVWHKIINYVRTFFEEIVSIGTDLLLLEASTSSQHIRANVVNCSLKKSSSSFSHSLHIVIRYSSRTEDSSISEPLSGQISNWQFRKYDIGTSVLDFL